jgi:hypothetical protein
MAGLGLIHFGFLAASAAVAVPILIHLLLRPRAQRVNIGSLRFLKLVLRDSTRRRKLRRRLLLALRVAAVALLAVLFARPYLNASGAEGRDREVVLLIDQSASMGVVQGGKTLLAQAHESAAQILKNLPAETATHVAYFDACGVFPMAEAQLDGARKPGYAGTDFGQALRWARDRMTLSTRPQRKVCLFTDLQRSGLRGVADEAFPADVAVEVIEVGKPLVKNLAVESAEATRTELRPGESVAVTAGILNAGPFPARDVRVRLVLEADGVKLPEQTQAIEIAGGSRQQVRFAVPVKKPGLHSGFVEIVGGDDFPPDDRRWLAFEARTPDRLLLVDGEPGPSVYSNETYYLEAALKLRLNEKAQALTPYQPERLAWTDSATLPDLTPFRVVALCNVARVGEADTKRLRAYVAGGGRLLVCTGKRVTPEEYEPLHRAGLVPATVTATSELGLYRFTTWDREHPILRALSDPQQGDLRRLGFRRITTLKPDPGAKVLAAARDGEPLLVEGRLEKGVVLLLASAVDRDWGDWPQSRLYVPLVHQIVGYLAERLPESAKVRVEPVGPGTDNPPGITRAGEVAVVRNLDPKESEIERLTPQQFRAAFQLAELDESAQKQVARAKVAPPPGSQRPDEIWPYIVWALLAVLLAEIFLANRTHA